jgi:hypothetical protein
VFKTLGLSGEPNGIISAIGSAVGVGLGDNVGEGVTVSVGVVVGVEVGISVGELPGINGVGIVEGDVSSVGGFGVAVAGSADGGGSESFTAAPISSMPTKLENILGQTGIRGIAISFAFTPPPNRPARSAILPVMARTIGRVIIMLFSPYP